MTDLYCIYQGHPLRIRRVRTRVPVLAVGIENDNISLINQKKDHEPMCYIQIELTLKKKLNTISHTIHCIDRNA